MVDLSYPGMAPTTVNYYIYFVSPLPIALGGLFGKMYAYLLKL